jgi:hypothetical protein
MQKLEIYCTTIKYYKILEKLPSYIIPLGLGEESYPKDWLTEKNGENISSLNKYYAEFTGLYWVWKNRIQHLNKDDLIGNCHNRVLWLNNMYKKKKKFLFSNLYSNLLKPDNDIFNNSDVIQVQPITFKKKSLLVDFEEIHKTNALKKCINYLDTSERTKFEKHLNGNKIFPHNMFITKVHFFEKYCEIIFPWLDRCFKYCMENNLCNNYNTRLPAFLAERFTSYWFDQFEKRNLLSYARLGKFFLSNKVSILINPIKLPFTFYQYPTIHKY